MRGKYKLVRRGYVVAAVRWDCTSKVPVVGGRMEGKIKRPKDPRGLWGPHSTIK